MQGLFPAEQMLIAKIQPVISICQLRSSGGPGQYRYEGNIIGFTQNISDITRFLPRHPKLLNVILVHRASDNRFFEFRVRRQKITVALLWLKDTISFDSDKEIDSTVLNSLPENGNIENEVDTIEIDFTFSNNFQNDIVVESAVPIVAYQKEQPVV